MKERPKYFLADDTVKSSTGIERENIIAGALVIRQALEQGVEEKGK